MMSRNQIWSLPAPRERICRSVRTLIAGHGDDKDMANIPIRFNSGRLAWVARFVALSSKSVSWSYDNFKCQCLGACEFDTFPSVCILVGVVAQIGIRGEGLQKGC